MAVWSVIMPCYKVPQWALNRLFEGLIPHLVRDTSDHASLGRALVHAVRNMDIHVMIVPNENGPAEGWPWGSAHSTPVGKSMIERHIEAYVSPRHECFFHLLLHEWVHHMLGHCDVWTSTPTFMTEHATEMEVLRIAKPLVSVATHEQMTKWAKSNVRMHYFESFVHHSPEIAEWCEYETGEQSEREAAWNREPKTSLTSSEPSQLPF